jgi:hypothetical protein
MWEKIMNEDLFEIQGELAKFSGILQKRYGEVEKEEANNWPNRQILIRTGNDMGYNDPEPTA